MNFTFDPAFYVGEARRAFDDEVIKKNISRLKKASEQLVRRMGEVPDVNFGEVLSYLRREFHANTPVGKVEISNEEKRALSYHLDSEWEYQFLKWCVQLLENEWNPVNLRGVLHSLLAHWEKGDPDGHKYLLDTVIRHIEKDQSRTAESLRPIKDSIKNPYKLGIALRRQGTDILSVCSIFSLPANRISYAYFSNVITAYYEKVNAEELDALFEILRKHNNVRTDKTVIPNWIVGFGSKSLPSELYDFAIQRIGDPFAKEKWAAFPMATREESSKLEEARRILAGVISSKVINIFFRELCNDTARKNFWLKYTDKVSDFRVYGTESSLSSIRNMFDREILRTHFRLVGTNTTNCALVMEIRDYTIIEFTDTGAMYAYKNDSANYKTVFKQNIERLDELKIPSLNMLMNLAGEFVTRYNDEGRMVHMGHWQRRLSRWIDRKIR